VSTAHTAAVVLVVAGTVVIVMACLAALTVPDKYTRLHYATAITSFGGPLIAVGLSVDNGPNLTTASILLPAALLFFSGPILSAAIGRTLVQRENRTGSEPPE
jgi:monovalent cation/proton antiporter MnhG/PhaG subunit